MERKISRDRHCACAERAGAGSFAAEFTFETDCSDVHAALSGEPDFVLLDVRGPAQFAAGHIPGAISLPHGKIIGSKMAQWPEETVFVTYCAGPHCNGARRAPAGRAWPSGQDHGRRTDRLAG